MKKLIISLIMLTIVLTGCGAVDENGNEVETTNRFYATDKTVIDGYAFYAITDRETSCQYFISTGNGVSIEPLDGIESCKK